MKMRFLGGVREIGASCCLLEIEGKQLLIDAGIRLTLKGRASSLPRLNLLRSKQIDLILLTHAHLDHSGALPVVHSLIPEAKIICTEGTYELIKILLSKSLDIMASHEESEFKTLFKQSAYESMLGKIFLTKFGHWFKPFPDKNIRICFKPAGHIMGAASILIEAEGKRIMFSGDFCIANQKTVLGFRDFDWQPDVLVMEATYGDEVHPSRREEEIELNKTVLSVIKNKGVVLIPAFAVGRSQEVIMILNELKGLGVFPSFPVYYDGLVVPVCNLYKDFGLMPSSFKGIILVGEKISRKEVFEKKPAVIIASSGNLHGGASLEYAKRLIDNPENAILFSGYQDEESPGRIMLEMEQQKYVWLGDKRYEIKCQVARYKFSAHADLAQLRHYAYELDPKVIVLNHSPYLIMDKLARSLKSLKDEKVIWTPSNRCLFDPFETNLDLYVEQKEVVVSKTLRKKILKGGNCGDR